MTTVVTTHTVAPVIAPRHGRPWIASDNARAAKTTATTPVGTKPNTVAAVEAKRSSVAVRTALRRGARSRPDHRYTGVEEHKREAESE